MSCNEVCICIEECPCKKIPEVKMNPIDITGKNWKLNLPIGKKESPDELSSEQFGKLKNEYFFIKNQALFFKAPCNGVTTKGSNYPRSELREMVNGQRAAWDMGKGTHSMVYTIACNHLPKNKPQVVMGQIHDKEDDVVEVRLTGSHLELMHDSTVYGTLLTTYKLGTFVEIKIITEKGFIKVSCNEKTISVKHKSPKGCYFKVGCYVQSNAEKGDKDDYGETALKKVEVKHQ